MSRTVSAGPLFSMAMTAALLAAGGTSASSPEGPAWDPVCTGLETGLFVRSVDRCGPESIVAATWPEESRGPGSTGGTVWVIDLGTGSRRQVLQGIHAWGVAQDPDGGFWVLPRAGDELIRCTREGREVERVRLPVRGQVVRRWNGTLLVAQFPFRARGPLLWRRSGKGFSPWTGRIDPGSGDLASLIRRNTVVLAAAGGTVVVARPFAGSELEVLDESGSLVRRITVPLDESSPRTAGAGGGELEPVFPLRDMALVGGRILCLLRRSSSPGAPGHRESLLVLTPSGGIERILPAPEGAARLVTNSRGKLFTVDDQLAVYRLRGTER